MKKNSSLFTVFCTVIFLAFTIFMIWFVPSYASVRSRISETRRDLELSRGREAKQQAEYDSAVAELPLILSELEEKNPAADKAEEALALAQLKALVAENISPNKGNGFDTESTNQMAHPPIGCIGRYSLRNSPTSGENTQRMIDHQKKDNQRSND